MNVKGLNNCKSGNHNLINILSHNTSLDTRVVRWCQTCGAIVVDGELDGRVAPGKYRKLQCPALAVQASKE